MKTATQSSLLQQLLYEEYVPQFGPRVGQFVREQQAWAEALDLALHYETLPFPPVKRRQIGFRAAYALEHAYFAQPEAFTPYVPDFIKAFPQAQHPSVHRHFGKMLSDLCARGAVSLSSEEAQGIAETCLSWIISPEDLIAVKVWAVEILLILYHDVAWISEMLPQALQTLAEDCSPGMKVRLRKWWKTIKSKEA
jgi:hypothetical protein